MIRRALPYAIGFMIFATVHYVVNRWLGTPISVFQTSVLGILYGSQFIIVRFAVYLLWEKRSWIAGVAVLALQLMSLEHIVYAFVYGILPAKQQALHLANVPFIATQFRGRIISGYIIILIGAIAIQATQSYIKSRRRKREMAQRLQSAQAQLTALESSKGTLAISSHFLRNMMVTVANYATHSPGLKAGEASLAFLELLEYVMQATRATSALVSIGTEWLQLENLFVLVRIKYGQHSVRVSQARSTGRGQTIPAFSWLTLVENALVHGIVSDRSPLVVTLRVSATGTAFACENSVSAAMETRKATGGHGLKLLRERLDKTMPEQYTLTIKRASDQHIVLLTTNSGK